MYRLCILCATISPRPPLSPALRMHVCTHDETAAHHDEDDQAVCPIRPSSGRRPDRSLGKSRGFIMFVHSSEFPGFLRLQRGFSYLILLLR